MQKRKKVGVIARELRRLGTQVRAITDIIPQNRPGIPIGEQLKGFERYGWCEIAR